MSHLSSSASELTVGELSKRSGVPASALRFYERQGLIHSRRTNGNQRRYSREVLRRVAFIRVSQRLGISLAAIRCALKLLPDGQAPTTEEWASISHYWQVDLNARIAKLEGLRDRLAECIGCGCMSLGTCELANPDDVAAKHGPGAFRL
ncbi:redox-sensitive transcriptional activator SoxR [Streptomyces sp. SCUT-3]|uniref:redox-sensitive transcriptional activator SoxR n=1 Tax=Streptomyces sp. SCUT-3 TaxID=2684469 RepID=UPI000CC1F448|nr:redox-sensitive transcriptional activator SoxR [Streptomyces sp. SCUT-3]PLW71722.1 redox-sensitive transcriptional activator SoxR [Streptomyces sp. DJ]QMV21214.1 redox-sensitive transcriptional activator SoxR [Streptomyces sp. SCUT-3]